MWVGLVLGLAALVAGMELYSERAEQWAAGARLTARVGFPLLLLTYIARPLNQLAKSSWSKAILRKRKWIGLGFAMSHTVHLAALYIAMELSGEPWDIPLLLGGGGAYALLYAMAFTSNKVAMQRMGRWWKRLHTFGIHYLWFIFFQSYAGRILDPETKTFGIVMTSIALAAAGIRFATWISLRKKRRANPA